MISYLDTSAGMKLVVDEPESEPLALTLSQRDGLILSSWLLFTEMHRASDRHPVTVSRDLLDKALAPINLVDVKRADFLRAANSPGRLRSLDAIHLGVALRIEADELITYDLELAAAAALVGLRVLSPGR